MRRCDVLIAGGGPAGCATALTLREYAPTLHILVANVPPPRRLLGETLPPPAAALLERLHLIDGFLRDGHTPTYSTRSAWGTERLLAHEFLFAVRQVGWQLDRTRFDALLERTVKDRGAAWCDARVMDIEHTEGGWRAALDDGEALHARFIVDATGRCARLCRKLRLRRHRIDALTACVVRFASGPSIDMTVESCADSWWYATALPDGERVLACLSDSDIVRERGWAHGDGWDAGLAATQFVRTTRCGSSLCTPEVFPANSGQYALPEHLAFLAVGDAVSTLDPLSSQGISKALRSGMLAAYGIADRLLHEDGSGVARYRRFVADEFLEFETARRAFYAQETRWPSQPFWQRRHYSPHRVMIS